MFIKKWKTEIMTIPNLLSLFRLMLIPVYLTLYRNAGNQRDFLLAGLVLALSCLTDAIDGKIARRFHMTSSLGKVLDPLADKITQFALILCLQDRFPALKPVLPLLVIKEVLQAAFGILGLRHRKILSGALPEGKICTAVLFVSLTLLVVCPGLPDAAVRSIALTDSLLLLLSFGGYFAAYFGKGGKLRDLEA